ncbi:hypothetical protein Nmel_017512, partial [Mimus melanotis]
PGPAAPRLEATCCAGGFAARPSPPPPAAAAALSAAPLPPPPWRPSRQEVPPLPACEHFRPQLFRPGVAAPARGSARRRRRDRHGDRGARAAAAMAAPPESLLRYCPPVLVSRRGDRAPAGSHPPKGAPPGTPASISATQQPQELLNAILPPR